MTRSGTRGFDLSPNVAWDVTTKTHESQRWRSSFLFPRFTSKHREQIHCMACVTSYQVGKNCSTHITTKLVQVRYQKFRPISGPYMSNVALYGSLSHESVKKWPWISSSGLWKKRSYDQEVRPTHSRQDIARLLDECLCLSISAPHLTLRGRSMKCGSAVTPGPPFGNSLWSNMVGKYPSQKKSNRWILPAMPPSLRGWDPLPGTWYTPFSTPLGAMTLRTRPFLMSLLCFNTHIAGRRSFCSLAWDVRWISRFRDVGGWMVDLMVDLMVI